MWSETQASVLKTPQQTSYVGGDLSVRVPVRTYSLVNIDPPRFAAGCGGIDAHFGSFSFISADAFKDLLRKIAQAAPGYFLHLAINSMCNPCSQLLSWFQDLMAKLNNTTINSCSVAKGLVNDLVKSTFDSSSAIHQAAQKEGTTSVFSGASNDWFSGMKDSFDRLITILDTPPQSQAQSIEQQEAKRKIGAYNVLVYAGANAALDARIDRTVYGGNTANASRAFYELMMATFGTDVVDPTSVAVGNSNLPSGSKTQVRGGLSVNNIRNGPSSESSDPLWPTCVTFQDGDDLTCTNVSYSDKWSTAINDRGVFPGARALEHRDLFGNTDEKDYEIKANSILGLMRDGGSLNNNARYRAFLGLMPPGAHYALMEVKHNHWALASVGRTLEDIMIDAITIALTSDMLRHYSQMFTASNKKGVSNLSKGDADLPAPTQWMTGNQARLQAELAELQSKQTDNMQRMQAILSISQSIRSTTMRQAHAGVR